MATCAVSGTILDSSETAVSGVTIRARILTPVFSGTSLVVPKEVTTTSATDGTWSLSLTRSQSFVLTIEFPPNSTDSSRKLNYSITTPASASATFASLAVETP